MIHKFVDFLCVTAGILIVWSLVLQVKRNFEEIKAYQTTQLVMLEKLIVLQTVESNYLKGVRRETSKD